jgi:hypothetical protein
VYNYEQFVAKVPHQGHNPLVLCPSS